MELVEYCGKAEYSILQFIFSITDEIREKITQRKFIYREQIVRYIKRRIDYFFKQFTFKHALLQTYKNEVFNSVMFKLNSTIKEHIIFKCV
ncbi:hypothetical protein R4Z10_10930 [Niallia sp. XMNu-256]|uniref:hypothetical protein n=1 Tax=Niallia sp. XMNu-256 TaxID=3082444 RepID=UPI0030D4A4A0